MRCSSAIGLPTGQQNASQRRTRLRSHHRTVITYCTRRKSTRWPVTRRRPVTWRQGAPLVLLLLVLQQQLLQLQHIATLMVLVVVMPVVVHMRQPLQAARMMAVVVAVVVMVTDVVGMSAQCPIVNAQFPVTHIIRRSSYCALSLALAARSEASCARNLSASSSASPSLMATSCSAASR
ncbi:hypothetical protein Vafri_1530 [Volvox africanus]|nr:hypothetical protein Vafri_1530 [Volvox africanus]